MKKIQTIEGFRAIAFFVIFLSHTGAVWHDWGGWSVSHFFVLSGFLGYYAHQSYSLDNSLKGCLNYMGKSLRRMYPLHLLMLAAAFLIELMLIISGRRELSVLKIMTSLIPNILLIQSWFPVNRIYFGYNGVSWYLSTFTFLRFLLPVLLGFMKNWSLKKAILILCGCIWIPVLLSIILTVGGLEQYREWFLYVFPPVRLIDYMGGLQVGYIFCMKKKSGFQNAVSAIQILLLAFSVAFTWFLTQKVDNPAILRVFKESIILFMPISLVGISCVAVGTGFLNRILSSEPLTNIGSVSMYAFLIHNMVIQYVHILLSRVVSENVNVLAWTIVSALITAVLTKLYIIYSQIHQGKTK